MTYSTSPPQTRLHDRPAAPKQRGTTLRTSYAERANHRRAALPRATTAISYVPTADLDRPDNKFVACR